MIEQSETIAKLSAAMFKAQGAMGGVAKTANNPHFKKPYANLESVIDTAKPALQAAGIVFTQAPGRIIDQAVEVTTMLIHAESGEWMRSTLHVPLGKVDPQGVGSSITYGLRYSLMATLGLPPVDDDGEAAMQRNAPAQRRVEQTSPPAPKMSYADQIQSSITVKGVDEVWERIKFLPEEEMPQQEFDRLYVIYQKRLQALSPAPKSLGEHLDNLQAAETRTN